MIDNIRIDKLNAKELKLLKNILLTFDELYSELTEDKKLINYTIEQIEQYADYYNTEFDYNSVTDYERKLDVLNSLLSKIR